MANRIHATVSNRGLVSRHSSSVAAHRATRRTNMAGTRVVGPSAQREERTAGFSIGTYGEDIVTSNAEEKFGPKYGDPLYRAKAMKARLVDSNGNITEKGWEILNKDALQLERNAMTWLKKKFISARDDGHDTYGDLVGTVWYDLHNETQRELIELGQGERIDMVDTSYGDLGNTAWKGVSSFGQVILGGAINFSAD